MAVSIDEFEKALISLEQAIAFSEQTNEPLQFKIARDACIQRFEFCIELAWKTSLKILGSSSTTAKPVLREMAQNGLIEDTQIWFDFVEARNKSSHTYNEDIAQDVFTVLNSFLPHGKALLEKLK